MCCFRSENSDALLYLKLWFSFYIRVEYQSLHEYNLALRAQLMCGGGGVVVAWVEFPPFVLPHMNSDNLPKTEIVQIHPSGISLSGRTIYSYIEKRAVRNGRLLRKSWNSSDLELASMYATFRESMKIFDRGPTNHKTSRLKHQQITARHSSSRRE